MAMADQRVKIDVYSGQKQAYFVLIHSLPCVTQFVDGLNDSLKACKASAALSAGQRLWLSTVLVGIVVTGTLNWAGFERRSLKAFKQSRLRWMFCYAKITWSLLLQASIGCLLKHYKITSGVLVTGTETWLAVGVSLTTMG